jgi:hypothetical protein
MTAYATCAYPDCYERIPYEPKVDGERARYCKEHMNHMSCRHGDRSGARDALYIKVKR